MKRPQDKPHDGKTTSGAHPGVSPSRGGEDVGLLDQLAEFSVSAGEYASALEYYEQILSIAERLTHVEMRLDDMEAKLDEVLDLLKTGQ